ncbi:MAG: MerR family transcriptional regulator [Acidobacteriota bacterium]|nr:MerR family transcriptional regulator [Acidobacteriota bacterium]
MKTQKAADKLVYKIEEVCRMTRIDAATIESWERDFPFLRAGKTGNGQKFFRRRDIEIIRRLKELLDQKKLTMAGIKRQIEEEFGMRVSGPVHPERLRKALYDVRDGLQEIAGSLERQRK